MALGVQTAAGGEPEVRPKRGVRSVASAAASLAAISILSPATGLLAEIALAWRFGASGTVDAYRVVVLELTYGQQLFIAFFLPFVIVPIFAEYRAQGKEEEAWILADSVGRLLLVFGSSIAAVLFLRPDWVVSVIGPGLV